MSHASHPTIDLGVDNLKISEVEEFEDGYSIVAGEAEEYEIGFAIYKEDIGDYVPEPGNDIKVAGIGTPIGLTFLEDTRWGVIIKRSAEQSLILRKIRQGERLIRETQEEIASLRERYDASAE